MRPRNSMVTSVSVEASGTGANGFESILDDDMSKLRLSSQKPS